METYKTFGTCSRAIHIEVDKENNVRNVKFDGGCPGNTVGVAKLVEGRNIDDVISILKGVQCRMGTSCPDQLARALEEYKEKNKIK